MTRYGFHSLLLLASCSDTVPTPEKCKALGAPEAVIRRCYHGNLNSGQYVGDTQCWPFSAPMRLRGIWVIGLEESEFYLNIQKLEEIPDGVGKVWFESDLLDKNAELLAAAQGKETRVYLVDFEGRTTLCDGMFGHFGMFPRQVIAERFYVMRRLQ